MNWPKWVATRCSPWIGSHFTWQFLRFQNIYHIAHLYGTIVLLKALLCLDESCMPSRHPLLVAVYWTKWNMCLSILVNIVEFMAIGVVRAWHSAFHAILFPKKYGLIPKKCEGITRHALKG